MANEQQTTQASPVYITVPDPAGVVTGTGSSTGKGSIDGPSADALHSLAHSDLVTILLDIECGVISGLQCLCNPSVVQALRTIDRRFSQSDAQLIIRELCGCQLKATTPTSPAPAGYVPVSGPANPDTPGVGVVTPAQPASTPSTLATDTTFKCTAALPPPNTFTAIR